MAVINEKELKKLFLEIKNDNQAVFESFYQIYRKLVYSIAFSVIRNKQDAEDITQMVFTKIYSIDKNKLPSKNETSWLYSITKNETINFLRRKNNNLNLEDIYEIEDNSSQITKIIDKQTYYKLISGLSDKEKEVVSLKILTDLTFEEIGKVLKTPTGTIKWRYYKSIHTLKMLLSNLGMFVITIVLGVMTLKNHKKANVPTNSENNAVKEETMREENENKTPTKEEVEKNKNSILEDNDSQTQENVIEISSENTNYIGLSFIGTSAIFLIITIIFSIIFTKRQLKRRKRLSK